MRASFLFVVISLITAGCPKHVEVAATPPTMSAEEVQLRSVEKQTAILYEEFASTCERQVLIGREWWMLGCTQSLGHPVPNYPANTCSEWTWVNQGVLTKEAWAQSIVTIDRSRSELGQVWESAPAFLKTNEAIIARGMNPWIVNPRWTWQCPPLPSTFSP